MGVISNNDIIDGNSFYPNEPVTREQLLSFMANYANTKGSEIKHNPINLILQIDSFSLSSQYRESVGWALDNGMFQSMFAESGHALQPGALVSRANIANLLYSLNGVIGANPQQMM